MKRLYDFVDSKENCYVDELVQFLRQKSISTTNEGVSECAELLCKFMNDSGISTKVYQTQGLPIVYGEVVVDPAAPTVMFYGHYDIQPADPISLWDTPPFEPTIKNGRIFARGSSDDKGQLYAHVKGYEAYKHIFGETPINVKYIFEGEEEIGSPSLLPFVLENKEMLKTDLVIFSDSHIHESGKPMLILGLKGMCYVEITLHGAKGDVHSMKAPVLQNPAWRMVNLLATLKGNDGFVKLEGYYDNVRPLLELEKEAVKKIPVDEAEILSDFGVDSLLENRCGKDYYYNLMFEPTCNIAGLHAGYTGEGSKTVLPNFAMAKLDLRLVPDQKPDEILEKLRKHLDKHGYADAKIKTYGMITPSRTPIDDPFVGIIKEAVEEVWGDEAIIFPGIGGAGPNYIFTDYLNVPCILLPLAYHDQKNHAPNENYPIKGYLNGIKSSATIIQKIHEKG